MTKGQVVCIVEAMKLMNEIEVSSGWSLSRIVYSGVRGLGVSCLSG